MYIPDEYRVDWKELDNKLEQCLTKLRNVIRYSLTRTQYVSGTLITGDIDLSYIDDFGVTTDFVTKFLDEEPGYVPSMELAMKFIACSDIGASALGFIDIDEKVIDNHNRTLSGLNAISYCFNSISEAYQEICDDLSDRFHVPSKEICDIFLGNKKEHISLQEFIKMPVTDVLYFTLRLGLPIQSLFDYNFYSICDKYFNG